MRLKYESSLEPLHTLMRLDWQIERLAARALRRTLLASWVPQPTFETTQGQIDGIFSQLLFKCYLPEVASVGD